MTAAPGAAPVDGSRACSSAHRGAGFIFCQDRIYQLTGECGGPEPLLLVFSQKDGAPLRIDRAQMQRFLSEALPSIETAAALAIAPSLQERLHRPPLEVKVFLDYEDGAIAARLDFSYGGIAVNPCTAESPPDAGGRILMRDTARELEAAAHLNRLNLRCAAPCSTWRRMKRSGALSMKSDRAAKPRRRLLQRPL